MYSDLAKSLITEFLGTLTLVFVGVSAVVQYTDSVLSIALAFGLVLVALIYAWGHFSGTHLNPAVSFSLAVAGRMQFGLMLAYWLVQLLGAALGAYLVYSFFGNAGVSTGSFTEASIAGDSTATWNAIALEGLLTFFLTITFLLTTRDVLSSVVVGLAVGLVLATDMLVGFSLTGASMNPARSFGSAWADMNFAGYWIYVVGPLLGALLAGLVYRGMFNVRTLMEAPHSHSKIELEILSPSRR
jgi:MIP family channel proteins